MRMITREMTIEEVVRRHPETIPVFRKFGLDCMDCQIAAFEAVEHGAGVHHVDVEKLMEELNKAVK
jgi:hybrid cluster-associated redox disulfide protein